MKVYLSKLIVLGIFSYANSYLYFIIYTSAMPRNQGSNSQGELATVADFCTNLYIYNIVWL